MDNTIQAEALSVFVYESATVLDGLFFEIYTGIEISQEQAIEIGGKLFKTVPSISYRYVDSEEGARCLARAFDILFEETAKAMGPDSVFHDYL
ncbi:MAG: hypothetical protein PHV68_00865 [Candidatus Gastranaerophilales bacterium]|nr:hypothetical protein [Candidatus Gastranaerophilales bacterium]